MLLVKLDVDDLQFEKMNPFEGTMAYAQNKRQQVVMTEKWAEMFKATGIHFSSMHPGIHMTLGVLLVACSEPKCECIENMLTLLCFDCQDGQTLLPSSHQCQIFTEECKES